MKRHNLLTFAVLYFFVSGATAIISPKENIEEVFSTAVVLTDNETVSFGIANFDPDALLTFDEDAIIHNDKVKTRDQLSVFNLPYTFELSDDLFSDSITAQISLIKQTNDINLFESANSGLNDQSIDKVSSFYLAYNKTAALNARLTVKYSLGASIMHYKNSYSYQSEFSQSLEQNLDNQFFNLSSNAAIFQPKIKLIYSKNKPWGKWELLSDVVAFSGFTFNGSSAAKNAHPSGFRWNNGAKLHYTLNTSKFHAESLYLKAQRSDIGGDMVDSFATGHFYEFGLGVLLDTQKFTSLSNNVGIGININKGSSLSGGSIVFYFNEQ